MRTQHFELSSFSFFRSKEAVNIGSSKLILEATNLKKVLQHFKAIVLSYTEKDGRRTHDVLIIGKNM